MFQWKLEFHILLQEVTRVALYVAARVLIAGALQLPLVNTIWRSVDDSSAHSARRFDDPPTSRSMPT